MATRGQRGAVRFHAGAEGEFTFKAAEVWFAEQREIPQEMREDWLQAQAHKVMERAVSLAPTSGDPNNYESRNPARGYVPLRESASVEKRKSTWLVKFTSRHAAAQHERLDYVHTEGQAKYLEEALKQTLPEFYAEGRRMYAKLMAERARRAVERAEKKARKALDQAKAHREGRT